MEAQEKILNHEKKIQLIQEELVKGGRTNFGAGSVLSHTVRKRAPSKTSCPLQDILEFNEKEQTLKLEPYVTQDQLVKYTLSRGFIPPVVAEFKHITVGGGVMGASLESSSHKWGQMNDSALSYELLLGDGSVIECTPNLNAELFWGVSGSYGAFGRLLSLKFPLLKAKPYVNVSSVKFSSIKEGISALEESIHSASPPDYVEGLVLGLNDFRVIVGKASETPLKNQFSLSSWASKWYHQKAIFSDEPFTMTLYDYLFRYDRGAFWMGTYGLSASLLARFWLEGTYLMPDQLLNALKSYPRGIYNTPKYPGALFRGLAGWMMDSATLYKWLHRKDASWFKENFVVQDFYLPSQNAEDFIRYALETTEIKPLWICPCKGTKTPQLFSPQRQDAGLLFDVGVYGHPIEDHSAREASCLLEKKTYSLSGKKMFYSWNFMTEEELFTYYDLESYRHLRSLGKAEGVFPSFQEKVSLREA